MTEGMTERRLPILDTSGPPQRAAKLVDDFTPALINQGAHHLCPGCGEPVAMRLIMEAVEELRLAQRTVAVFGIAPDLGVATVRTRIRTALEALV